MEPHFLQSPSWEKFINSEGKKTFRLSGTDFSALAVLETTPLGNYLYCPYGPFLTKKSALKTALKALRSLGKSESAIFIRIEPTLPFSGKEMAKYAKKSHDLNPKDTWILDLAGSDEELKQKLPSRLCRYYRSAEKNGLSLETSTNPKDVKKLLSLQRSLASKKGIKNFPAEHYAKQLQAGFATLYFVKQDKEILAAGLVFDSDSTRYNLQGAQSPAGTRLHATGILTIKLILDAKAKGLTAFDFWGIAPDGAKPSHPWYGFTAFKKTFAGEEKHYAGTWDIPLSRGKYLLYSLLRKLNRLKRKVLD